MSVCITHDETLHCSICEREILGGPHIIGGVHNKMFGYVCTSCTTKPPYLDTCIKCSGIQPVSAMHKVEVWHRDYCVPTGHICEECFKPAWKDFQKKGTSE